MDGEASCIVRAEHTMEGAGVAWFGEGPIEDDGFGAFIAVDDVQTRVGARGNDVGVLLYAAPGHGEGCDDHCWS
jgi:hypothetical protein